MGKKKTKRHRHIALRELCRHPLAVALPVLLLSVCTLLANEPAQVASTGKSDCVLTPKGAPPAAPVASARPRALPTPKISKLFGVAALPHAHALGLCKPALRQDEPETVNGIETDAGYKKRLVRKLAKHGCKIDPADYTVSQLLDMSIRVDLAAELAKLGVQVDWRSRGVADLLSLLREKKGFPPPTGKPAAE
ncbi:MAG: hypothetical protein JXR37_30005 [Kiritimatiellae bacterium]|nr:hypothetical protein [Kiritimatiellia bacterium]